MRGDLFQRLKKHTEFTDAGDYIFAHPKTGEMLNKKIYYRHWEEIVRNTGLKSKHPKPTFYCLRHTYATFRLLEDVPVFDIAENMGTSVKFIEEHYGHAEDGESPCSRSSNGFQVEPWNGGISEAEEHRGST